MSRGVAEELAWLKKNPAFSEKPATLVEFLGSEYLDILDLVRPPLVEMLNDMCGDTVSAERPVPTQLAIITGGIGIGKTTIASIVLPYLVHWVLCLKDPQGFFKLLPGSRIAFMQMSTSESQAKEVVFGDIKARIVHGPWFKAHPPDPKYKNQFRWPEKDIWIVPGDSAETTFEGYNILGGILDEADSHKVTKVKDYADQGYETIFNRMSSRFDDRGFLLVIGQMKSSNGFAQRKYEEFRKNPDAFARRMAIWESRGDEYYADKDGKVVKFPFDMLRKKIIPTLIAEAPGFTNDNITWVPEIYRDQFETNPEKALKDLAGIPPIVGSPFISLVHKVHACKDRWIERHGDQSPVNPDGVIEKWWRAQETLKRVAHVDIGYAEEGDAMGIAMGHVREMVVIDGERKPHIDIDIIMRMSAPAGGEIFMSDMRHQLYAWRNDFGFKLETVTLDGFQSQDTIQQLAKRRFHTDYLSVDRQVLPYHDLREAIYEDRIDFPPYMVHYRPGDSDLVEITVKELTELIDVGHKIDHPEGGSKDVADALAGVTTTLLGDRRYHRRVTSITTYKDEKRGTGVGGFDHHAWVGAGEGAPIPPAVIGQVT